MKSQFIKGWYLPSYDTHFENMLKKNKDEYAYQKPHRDYVLSHVDKFDVAIDVGANVVLSKDLCKNFRKFGLLSHQ